MTKVVLTCVKSQGVKLLVSLPKLKTVCGKHSGLRIGGRDNSIHKGLRICIVPAQGISWNELQNSTWRGRRFWADYSIKHRIHALSSEPTIQSLCSNSWRNNYWTSHWSSNRENSWPIWTWNCNSTTQWCGTDISCNDFQRKESVRGWSPYSHCWTQIRCRKIHSLNFKNLKEERLARDSQILGLVRPMIRVFLATRKFVRPLSAFFPAKRPSIIAHSLVPADCIFWVSLNTEIGILFERRSTPRPGPKVKLKSNWHSQQQQQSLCDDVSTSTRRLVREGQSGIRDVRGCTTDDQTSTRTLVQDLETAVDTKPQFEIDPWVQHHILQDEEKKKEINEKLEKSTMGSGTKDIRNDLSNGTMILSNESSRAIYDIGNMELIELRTNLGDNSVSFLPEARSRGIEHVSMRRLASTQSKYVGPNQDSICRVKNSLLLCLSTYFKRKEKRGHNPCMATRSSQSHGCKKRSIETLQKHINNDRWQNDEVFRESQLAHGCTEEWVKYIDYISKIDISHDAPYRQRLRYENTVYMRGVDSNKQAGPLCHGLIVNHQQMLLSAFNELKAKGISHVPMHLRTRQKTHWIQQSNNTWIGWVSTGQRISHHLHPQHGQKEDWHFSKVARQGMVGSVTSPYAHKSTFSRCARSHARCDHTSGARAWRFACLKNQSIIGHVFVEFFFHTVCSYFLFTCILTDDTCCLSLAIDWNQTEPMCYFAREWTAWPSGRSDPKHNLWVVSSDRLHKV